MGYLGVCCLFANATFHTYGVVAVVEGRMYWSMSQRKTDWCQRRATVSLFCTTSYCATFCQSGLLARVVVVATISS